MNYRVIAAFNEAMHIGGSNNTANVGESGVKSLFLQKRRDPTAKFFFIFNVTNRYLFKY